MVCRGILLMSHEPFSILAVCTGNVCRSPAVERLLATKLGPTVTVRSAGTHALVGHPISDPMAALLTDSGIEPDSFEARRLSENMLKEANLVLTMTALSGDSSSSYGPQQFAVRSHSESSPDC
jgi:protein-tyrosine phosphatase